MQVSFAAAEVGMRFGRFAALLVFLFVVTVNAEPPGVYAITNGTVHPVTGPAIPNGVVVIRNGLIEAVGANIAIPPDAALIDAQRGHVYPGLINAQTSLGVAAAPRRARSSSSDSPARETSPAVTPTPAYAAVEHVRFEDGALDDWRRAGVTTVLISSAIDIFNGQSVLLNLGGGELAANVIRSPAAMQVSFNTRTRGTYPGSLMGVISYLRQTFLDAQQHAAAHAVYQRNPSGLRRPESDRALAALAPVMRRELPVVFIADTADMIRRAQSIAREFNLRYVISGARQAYAMPDELRDVPVLVSVRWPSAPASDEDREEQPLRIVRDRQLAPGTPAALAKAGVAFALVAGSDDDFLPGIRTAIENGLTEDAALRAVTLTPATIFGVERQLGSLERGKIANVVIADRPIFDRGARISRVLVDGREIRMAPRRSTTTTRRAESRAEGTWNLTVRMPDGSVSITVTLEVENGVVTGTFAGDRGSGDIRNGSFDDPTLEFTISAQTDAEASDWAFRGRVEGSNITGTVATNLGTFEFSGSKSR